MVTGSTGWSSARARGDARPDSDYDVAVFLRSLSDRWAEFDRLAPLRVDIIDETGAFFDAIPYPADAWQERTPQMHHIRQDGIAL
ncbi:nucleotidyltransferase domain-containing protein [Rhodopila globiformis]|uniref:nucleotidyltransferase domain-containing protein n=1 Tax=Rhodopila globiformis TaxID=1071 RepID=UPI001EFC5147|nr:nucleotidyltransferase domain-containing protein [Rhodopila globiformis]